MKVNSNKGNGVETNSKNRSLDFGIGDPSIVIEIIRNRIYSFPIQTLVQEYLCNGRDASRETGTEEPLEVTLPSLSSPVFKVRDFGCGISPDRMEKVFVLYGSSTKRNSDKQTGGFGIGAKSAWAYTDGFSITTFIDGTARHYLAHIGSNNCGSLDFLGENPTNQKNGTEIQIGVKSKDINEFFTAALRATFFWDKRPIFKTTAEIPSWYTSEKPIYSFKNASLYKQNLNVNFLQYPRNYFQSGIIMVIDGIPYGVGNLISSQKITSNVNLSVGDGNVLAVKVGNDVVEVSASREQISDSEENRKTIEKVVCDVLSEINKENENTLGKISSFKEFAVKSEELHSIFKVEFNQNSSYFNYKKNGTIIFTINSSGHFSLNDSTSSISKQSRFSLKRDRLVKENGTIFKISQYHFVYNDICKNKNTPKEKLSHHLKKNGWNNIVYLEGDLSDSSFIELTQEFQAIPVSSLSSPPRKTNTAKKAITPCKDNISVFVLTYINNQITKKREVFDATSDSRQFVYFTQAIYDKNGITDYTMIAIVYFLNENGYTPCFMAPSYAKKAESYSNFTSFEEFLSSDNKELIKKYRNDLATIASNPNHIYSSSLFYAHLSPNSFNDPILKKTFSSVINAYQSSLNLKSIIPTIIADALVSKDTELQEHLSNLNLFFSHLNNNYHLWKHLRLESEPEVMNDFLGYVNNKFKGEK